MSRGFFEIGIWHPKSSENVGTLWRSAYQLGASGVFTVGARYRRQASDTVKTDRQIPMRHFSDIDDLLRTLPRGAPLVAVEMGGKPLTTFKHPPCAIYLLGAEDHGIAPDVLARCHHMVSLEAARTASYNVAIAGALVMYDRVFSGKSLTYAERRVEW